MANTSKFKRLLAGALAVVTMSASVALTSFGGFTASAATTDINGYSVSANGGLKNVMYYGDWAIWGGQKNFMVKDIPGDQITHLNFAFLDFDKNGDLYLCDGDADYGHPMGQSAPYDHSGVSGILPAMQDLRAAYPNLRIGVSVGGWSKSANFTPVAKDPTLRAKFVKNLEDFLVYTDMDFIDLDWEYPGSKRDGDSVDNKNDTGTPYAEVQDGKYFVQLLTDIKTMEKNLEGKTGRIYELSAALPSTPNGFENGGQAYLKDVGAVGDVKPGSAAIGVPVAGQTFTGIPATQAEMNAATTLYVKKMFEQLDFGNLMTYDMRGSFDTVTGHHGPLYSHPNASLSGEAKTKNFSADLLISYLLGYDKDKLGKGQTIEMYATDATNGLISASQPRITDKNAVPAKKIVLGAQFYTRGWHEIDTTKPGPISGSPELFAGTKATNKDGTLNATVGATPEAPMTPGDGGWATGVWSYGSINALKAKYPGLTYKYDAVAEAPYLYNASGAFFTFDDPRSITAKANYVKNNQLGGIISWSAAQDGAGNPSTNKDGNFAADTGAGSLRSVLTQAEKQGLWGSAPLAKFGIAGRDYPVTTTVVKGTNANNGSSIVQVTLQNTSTATKSLGLDAMANAKYAAGVVGSPTVYITVKNGVTISNASGLPYGALSAVSAGTNVYKIALGGAVYGWDTFSPGDTIAFGLTTTNNDPSDIVSIDLSSTMYKAAGSYNGTTKGPNELGKKTIYGTSTTNPTIDTRATLSSITYTTGGTQNYTGSALTVSGIVVKNSAGATVAATEYDISYANNINIGAAIVTATAKSASTTVKGSVSTSFTIQQGTGTVTPKIDISTYAIKFTATNADGSQKSSYDYSLAELQASGFKSTPAIELYTTSAWNSALNAPTYDPADKVSLTNFDITYSNNTIVTASAYVTVTPKTSNTAYTGSASKQFMIGQTAGSSTAYDEEWSVSKVYDSRTAWGGKLWKVLYNGRVYELKDGQVTSVGAETATSPTGYYGVSWWTDLGPASIGGGTPVTTLSINLNGTAVVNGSNAVKVGVEIKNGTQVLTEGTHYTLTWSNNTAVGVATVKISGVATNGFSGDVTKQFQIYKANLSDASKTTVTFNGTNPVVVSNGNTLTKDTDYTYTTSGTTYTITGKGTVTGFTTGTVGGSVTTIPVTSVSLQTSLALTVGSNSTLVATVNPSNATNKAVTWKSSNTAVATVDASGKVIAVAAGTATVTVTTADGVKTASCVVTVSGGTTKSISHADVTVNFNNTAAVAAGNVWEYTSVAITPAVTIKDGAKTLILGTDYTVAYSNNINVGTATVTITGKGAYSGTRTKNFNIVGTTKSISHADVTVNFNNTAAVAAGNVWEYTSVAITPAVTIKDGAKTLILGTDYTVAYSNNINVGTATVTITGKGAYSGTRTKNFNIVGTTKSISHADVTVNFNNTAAVAAGNVWEYTSVAITPAVTIKDGAKTLILGTDYTVAYSNNINVGTATVTITGKGAYSGTRTKNFNIVGTTKSISHADVTVNFNNTAAVAAGNVWEYTSVAITPAVTIKDGAKTLILGTDYTVAYSNNINVGTATVTITGKGAYSGTRTKNFNIVGTTKSISHADVTVNFNNTAAVAAGNVWEYTSVAITPAVTIKDGAKTLILGTDYTVAYSNNINVGTATVTITGKGAYSGTRTKNFNIVGTTKSISHADVTVNFNNTAAVAAGNVWEYTSVAITPAVTIKDGAKTLILGTDYIVAYSNNINVGTATVTITGKGAYSGTRTKNFNIVGTTKSISHADVTVNFNNIAAVAAGNVWEYTSVAITPAVTIKDGAKTLILGTDYTVAYSNNINVGTATVTITGKGAYSGTRTKNFNII